RATAQNWLVMIKSGIDPADSIKQQRLEAAKDRASTFQAVYDRWCKDIAAHRRRGLVMMRDARLMLLPTLRDRPMRQLTRQELRELLVSINQQRGKWRARSALVVLKSVFNHALDLDLVNAVPLERLTVKALFGTLTPRLRLLSEEEA